MRLFALALVLPLLVSGSVHAGLQFEFDYRYDTKGFFDDPIRREALEAAGRVVNRYVDDLEAIIPEGDNGWASFFSPPNGAPAMILKDLPVQADTMQIFVAGTSLRGRLAQSIDTAPVGNGDPEWKDIVAYRGEFGAAGDPATDFGPMGGTISFNNDPSEVPWHFGLSTEGLNANEFDFVTVAMHELLHLLGIGISVSFADHVNSSGEFVGAESLEVGSPTNPYLKLDEFESHWQSGTKSTWNGNLQEALLAPGIYPGRRTFPSKLDRAALRDIGWEEALAGDANRDRSFGTGDLLQVFQIGRYETGELAGWSEGDWNDNGMFESGDLIEALQTGSYEQTPTLASDAAEGESITMPLVTVNYDAQSGGIDVQTDSSALTALQIVSAQNFLVGGNAWNLGGPFDIDRTDKLFVMKLDGFDSLELGPLLPPDLSLAELAADLRIEGAWLGGGASTSEQLKLVPEPAAASLLAFSLVAWPLGRRRSSRPR